MEIFSFKVGFLSLVFLNRLFFNGQCLGKEITGFPAIHWSQYPVFLKVRCLDISRDSRSLHSSGQGSGGFPGKETHFENKIIFPFLIAVFLLI